MSCCNFATSSSVTILVQILVSSVNILVFVLIQSGKSLTKIRNSGGSNTEPCGIPLRTSGWFKKNQLQGRDQGSAPPSFVPFTNCIICVKFQLPTPSGSGCSLTPNFAHWKHSSSTLLNGMLGWDGTYSRIIYKKTASNLFNVV